MSHTHKFGRSPRTDRHTDCGLSLDCHSLLQKGGEKNEKEERGWKEGREKQQ